MRLQRQGAVQGKRHLSRQLHPSAEAFTAPNARFGAEHSKGPVGGADDTSLRHSYWPGKGIEAVQHCQSSPTVITF